MMVALTSSDRVTIEFSVATLLAGGLITWLVTWAYFRRSRSRFVLAYRTNSEVVVPPPSPEEAEQIEIRWLDNVVDSLTKTSVRFSNDGNQLLSGSMITEVEPLRMVIAGDAQAVRIVATGRSRKENGWLFRPASDQTTPLTFDFLEPKDWIVLEVLHSGPPGTVRVLGTLKGVNLRAAGSFEPAHPEPPSWWAQPALPLVAMGLASAALGLTSALSGVGAPLTAMAGIVLGASTATVADRSRELLRRTKHR